MWKTISIGTYNALAIFFTFAFLTGCVGNPPKMERPVSVWNGAPEREAICRIKKPDAAALIRSQAKYEETKQLAEVIAHFLLADGWEVECIPAAAEEFKKYGCMTFDDIGVIQRHIENLTYSCEKWKK